MGRAATARQVDASTTVDAPPPPAPRRRRSGLLRPRNLLILLITIAVLVFGAIEVHQRITHVYEYDSRVMADLITVSSRVSGVLTALEVREGDRISKGDVLARIDDRASELRVRALEAQLASMRPERERLQAQRKLLEDQIGARSQSRESSVSAFVAGKAALEAELKVARSELERAESLYQSRVISSRQVDRARADVTRLESELRRADAQTQQARGTLLEARVEVTGLRAIDSEIEMLEAQTARLEAELGQQRIDLEDRTIRSPIDGVVDRTFVEAGEYVGAGQRIALIHDPGTMYVEANIKETQVGRLRVGQPVDITVDAFPGREFKGKVRSIGTSTTSNFALLPTPNPSGNFTKITQRVPVRIALEPTDARLSPGMMVEVNIDVRDR